MHCVLPALWPLGRYLRLPLLSYCRDRQHLPLPAPDAARQHRPGCTAASAASPRLAHTYRQLRGFCLCLLRSKHLPAALTCCCCCCLLRPPQLPVCHLNQGGAGSALSRLANSDNANAVVHLEQRSAGPPMQDFLHNHSAAGQVPHDGFKPLLADKSLVSATVMFGCA